MPDVGGRERPHRRLRVERHENANRRAAEHVGGNLAVDVRAGGNQNAAAVAGVRRERLAAAAFQSARRQQHDRGVRRQAFGYVRGGELRAAGPFDLIGASRRKGVPHVKGFASEIAGRRHDQH